MVGDQKCVILLVRIIVRLHRKHPRHVVVYEHHSRQDLCGSLTDDVNALLILNQCTIVYVEKIFDVPANGIANGRRRGGLSIAIRNHWEETPNVRGTDRFGVLFQTVSAHRSAH